MFRLTAEFINTRVLPFLNGDQFAALCSELLISIARGAGIPVTHLNLTLRTQDPDGGLDARCERAPMTSGRLIPATTCGYQFKSGSTRRSAADVAIGDIIEKPRVVELIKSKNPFVFISALDYRDSFEKEVTDLVRKEGLEVQDGGIVVISGLTLAGQLVAFPAYIARHFGLEVNLDAFQAWSNRPTMSNPYREEARSPERLEELRKRILPARSRCRIVGEPGDGKTRTVLEALRGTPLQEEVLYAPQADDVTPDFISFLRTTPDINCTLIVDEVDQTTAFALMDRLAFDSPGLRVVLIGVDATARSELNTLKVEGLSNETLVDIIEAIVPGIPRQAAQEMASVCENSPKFAVLLAQRVRENPDLASHQQRLADPQIQNALDKYLPQDRAEWVALSAIALLERLGWDGESEEECRIVYGLMGLDPENSRRIVDQLHRRHGIAPMAGRYRYVSPRILGDHLAATQVGSWSRDFLKRFQAGLIPQMSESFARRLRGLSSALRNREAVEEVILGDQGPFRDLAALEEGHLAVLFRHLASPFRRSALKTLGRIIDSATDDQLRAAANSRRELVWALEELLWPEETFAEAVRLLFRLAIAENESIANNATGILTETFQIRLGRTAAGHDARMRALQKMTAADSVSGRILAAKALGRAITTSRVGRMGGPPTDVAGMPAESWHPATYGEMWSAYGDCTEALAPLLKDSDVTVRSAAAEALSEGLEAAIVFPRVIDRWTKTARLLVGQDYESREPMLDRLQWRLDREALDALNARLTDLKDEEREQVIQERTERIAQIRGLFEELRGSDFSSRFRLALSGDYWRLQHRSESPEALRVLAEQDDLIREVLAKPELFDQELNWLLMVSGSMPEYWIDRMGRLDTDHTMRARLMQATRVNDRAIGWVSLYTIAQTQQTGLKAGDFDTVAEEIAKEGVGPLQLFDLYARAEYTPNRFIRIVELLDSKQVPATLLQRITFSSWKNQLSPGDLAKLAEAVLWSPDGQAAAISLLTFYLHSHPDAVGELANSALALLEATSAQAHRRAGGIDDWAELAKRLADVDPHRMTGVIFSRLSREDEFLNEELTEALLAAWRAGNKHQLFVDFYGPRLEMRDLLGFRLRLHLEKFPLAEVGEESLLTWVKENPSTRARPIAQMIGRPAGRPSDLHASLLESYPDLGVGDAFLSDLISGTWWGPASERTRGLLTTAKTWLEDDRPAVRLWAEHVFKVLEDILQQDEAREAEERFR